MKRLAMKLEPSPVPGLPSYLDMIRNQGGHERQSSLVVGLQLRSPGCQRRPARLGTARRGRQGDDRRRACHGPGASRENGESQPRRPEMGRPDDRKVRRPLGERQRVRGSAESDGYVRHRCAAGKGRFVGTGRPEGSVAPRSQQRLTGRDLDRAESGLPRSQLCEGSPRDDCVGVGGCPAHSVAGRQRSGLRARNAAHPRQSGALPVSPCGGNRFAYLTAAGPRLPHRRGD